MPGTAQKCCLTLAEEYFVKNIPFRGGTVYLPSVVLVATEGFIVNNDSGGIVCRFMKN